MHLQVTVFNYSFGIIQQDNLCGTDSKELAKKIHNAGYHKLIVGLGFVDNI